MIAKSSNIETRLSESIKIFWKLLYSSSTLKCKIIQKCIPKPFEYLMNRFANVNGFKSDSGVVQEGLKTLVSLNLIDLLGLKRVRKNKKLCIN